jgi:protein-S-isoprenylcysteine O-methyltransferase Ste14
LTSTRSWRRSRRCAFFCAQFAARAAAAVTFAARRRAMARERTARLVALGGSAVFLVIAPGTVAGYVPWLLTRWHVHPPLLGLAVTRIAGAVILLAGGAVLLDSFRRFALDGLGTPAPPFPTRTLVVTGLYRFVRNPMYCGVIATIAGQALLLGSSALLAYAAIVWLGFHLFVLVYEEPTLEARYGEAYAAYRRGVARWVPRVTPWTTLPM